MGTNFDFVSADHVGRLGFLKTLQKSLSNPNPGYLGIDEDALLEFMLCIDSSNKKLSHTMIHTLSLILKKESFQTFSKALPYIMDVMSHLDDDMTNEAHKLFKELLRCAPNNQRMKMIEAGLHHISSKVKILTMKSVSERDVSYLGPSVKDQLESLLKSDRQQLCDHANDLLKRMIGRCELAHDFPVDQSVDLRKIEKLFEKSLSDDPKYCFSSNKELLRITREIKDSLESDPDKNLKSHLQALIQLRSHVGVDKFESFAKALRSALSRKHSHVIKEACITTVFLLVKKNMVKAVEDFIQHLTKCLSSPSDDVSSYAFIALKILLNKFSTSNVLVNVIFNINSKSPKIRKKIGELLLSKIENLPQPVLEGCMMSFEQSVKHGLNDEEPEVREVWRRLFVKCPKICEKMTNRIYVDVFEKANSEQDVRCKDQGTGQNYVELNNVGLSNIKQLSSGEFSSVISGKFMGKKIALRKIPISDVKRCRWEVELFRLTGDSGKFTPMLFELELPRELGIMMPFYPNLIQALNENLLRTEDSKIRVVRSLAKGLHYLHSFGIVHGSLEPRHIFIIYSNETVEAKIRNFGRSVLESEVPHHRPSQDWADPKALMIPGNVSKGMDLYSLGLIAYYIWSGGLHHGEKVIPGLCVKGRLELENKLHQGKMAIIRLTSLDKVRPSAERIQIFPVFWKRGSYRYFVERLREFLRRSDALESVIWNRMDWTNLVPVELKDMVIPRGLTDKMGHLVFFLRNLSIHGDEESKRRTITGPRNKDLEEWIKKNFEKFIEQIFDSTYEKYDMQLVSELQSIII